MTRRSARANALLILGSICLSLLLAEAALRVAQPGLAVRYAVWPPGLEQIIVPDARDTPGTSETHRFRITAQGYRGRQIGDARLRIAAFGGSTTESLFVPEERSWPRLVEQRLTSKLGVPAWVGNFGKSARNTRQHVLDAKYVLPQFPAQIALFLVGVNDLGIALTDPAAKPMSIEEIVAQEYLQKSLLSSEIRLPRVRLLGLTRDAARALADRFAGMEKAEPRHVTAQFYRQHRKNRAESAMTPITPDINPWLDEYERNLAQIADVVQQQGILPVFISQPTMWSAAVPKDIEASFWLGWTDGEGRGNAKLYYSSEAMGRMMKAYNERLRSLARDKNVPLIDTAQKLTKNPSYFYDEVHYNEAGSRAIAEIIAQELPTIINERGIVLR